jgi:hypothetical protein
MIVGARRATDTYGSALKAHPGKSQGRPTTNPRSRRNVYERSAQPAFVPGCPASRTVAPYSPIPKSSTAATTRLWKGAASAAFDTGDKHDRGAAPPVRTAIKTRGHFPDEQVATKLIYHAIHNAGPQWTQTRGWTKALLAFKIHFGDRRLTAYTVSWTPSIAFSEEERAELQRREDGQVDRSAVQRARVILYAVEQDIDIAALPTPGDGAHRRRRSPHRIQHGIPERLDVGCPFPSATDGPSGTPDRCRNAASRTRYRSQTARSKDPA